MKLRVVNYLQRIAGRLASLTGQRARYILVLLSAQLASIAVGLWIHQRLLKLSVRQEAQRAAVEQVRGSAARLSAVVEAIDADRQTSESDYSRTISRTLQQQYLPSAMQWVLTDPQWRVVVASPKEQAAKKQASGAVLLAPGTKLRWVTVSKNGDVNTEPEEGLLALSDGHRVAVACRLEGNAGYLVVHGPLAATSVPVEATLALLAPAAIIMLIWTSPLLGIVAYMIFTRFHDESNQRRAKTEEMALKRIQSLARTRDAVIVGLAKLAESRDESTGHHLERIAAYSYRLTAAVHQHSKYRGVVKREFVQIIGISSALHDIGKVGIEDQILLKQGPLTDDERRRMQQHTLIGEQCLLEIERRLGTSNFLQIARQIALSHHERWDGSGYPQGLVGREIPLAARIVAIADVYDALVSRRCYKDPMPHEQCVAIIRSDAGKHFDPDLVEVFLTLEGSFRQISQMYTNAVPDKPVPEPSLPPTPPQWSETLPDDSSLAEELLAQTRQLDEELVAQMGRPDEEFVSSGVASANEWPDRSESSTPI